ncbi:unnamed protein product [Paramecium octaurelia]|uniref:Uncharacterized protein n=1 Tax=Paramecium octaurelia TaxID=43137 RepID=A0A8S1WK59_PAROT|nr:unnamed protein product [Paramecium octaurelia]
MIKQKVQGHIQSGSNNWNSIINCRNLGPGESSKGQQNLSEKCGILKENQQL